MSEVKHVILWLDDEPGYMFDYVDAMRDDRRLDVVFLTTIKDGLEYLDNAHRGLKQAPAVVIWDMLMPPGPLPHDITENGLTAGIVFYEQFRKIYPATPSILLTNIPKPEILRRFDAPEACSHVFHKSRILPIELLELVLKILQLGERELLH